jgi:hypothetical protein
MNASSNTAIPSGETERHVAHIAAALDELSTKGGDMARFGDVAERLGLLRLQYRAQPKALDGHLPQLRELSQRFDALLGSRLAQVVDRYHGVVQEIRRAEREREFWREYLIRKAPAGRRASLNGTAAVVVIRSAESRLLPPAGTEPRTRLERLVRETGRWDEVSQLSRTKLQRALERGHFDAGHREAIGELCPLTVVRQVSSQTRSR